MRTGRGRTAVALATVAITIAAAGGVVAATQSSDEAALQPARGSGGGENVERRVEALLRKMTIDDKLNQIQLLSDGQIKEHPEEASKPVGGVFSLTDPVLINKFQKQAMSSKLKIPILFAYDTIHGYRTIFPIPLGAASSFDPNVGATDHRIGARESAAVGLKQIYSPMVDVSHEPRWGRIAEAGGEDPYLNSVFAAARVKAAQGRDYSKPDKVVTSVKHYAAYGQPEGGRDYNTTDMSVRRLHDLYLPPFKAAIDAGSDTAMCSFNSISGSPGCADKALETDLLKKRWGFDGFIESDYTAVAELINHGVAGDGAEAAAAALNAGTDSEMVSQHIRDNAKQLLADGVISERRIDDAVRRILRVKFRAGLFENPYVDVSQAEAAQLKPDAVKAARDAAGRSMVLLKNEGSTLPLKTGKKTAVIGPLGDDRTIRRRTSARTPTSAPRRRPPRGPTRSCSRSASRASRAARPRRAATSTCRVRRRSSSAASRRRRAASRSPSCCSTAGRWRSAAWSMTPRRSSKRGSPASRPATRSRTSCSARSTPAASCRCRSRARSARCRSTTTTSRPAARAT
jgi:beta-glucosidase